MIDCKPAPVRTKCLHPYYSLVYIVSVLFYTNQFGGAAKVDHAWQSDHGCLFVDLHERHCTADFTSNPAVKVVTYLHGDACFWWQQVSSKAMSSALQPLQQVEGLQLQSPQHERGHTDLSHLGACVTQVCGGRHMERTLSCRTSSKCCPSVQIETSASTSQPLRHIR